MTVQRYLLINSALGFIVLMYYVLNFPNFAAL